jgi:hypothetical protein
MKPVLYSSQNCTRTQQKRENYRPISLMNIDAKKSANYLQALVSSAFEHLSLRHSFTTNQEFMKVVGKSIFLNPTSSSPKPTVT